MKSSYWLDGQHRRRQVEISMTPMIDVIFLLLVFFIATSTFRAVEKLLPSGLAEIKSNAGNQNQSPPEISLESLEQVVIRLKKQPDQTIITINGQAIAHWDELKNRLNAMAQVAPSVPVIIDPEPTVTAKDVVRVYDWSRASGLSSVHLAIRP